jgi:hypothetical protein
MAFQTEHFVQEGTWKVTRGGVTLLEYIYREAGDPNPAFRTVRTPEGHQVAIYRPWDHPWHLGMFFSWKYIDGKNFWESFYENGSRNVAVTDDFEPVGDADGPGFHQKLSYVSGEGETLLKEQRRVRIAEAEGGYVIRWEADFDNAAGRDLVLDRTEVTEKTPWGGYAGITVRLNRNFLHPVITTDQGVMKAEESHRKPFNYCDYTGYLDGHYPRRMAGVCLMDHPANPRYPSPMLTYDDKDMQFLQIAPLCWEPCTLPAGGRLSLRYSAYVHDGQVPREQLERLWREETGRGA